MTTTTKKTVRLLACSAVLAAATMTTACTPLTAICGAWLATPCIICFNDNPNAAVDQSLIEAAELPMTATMSSSSSSSSMSSMPY